MKILHLLFVCSVSYSRNAVRDIIYNTEHQKCIIKVDENVERISPSFDLLIQMWFFFFLNKKGNKLLIHSKTVVSKTIRTVASQYWHFDTGYFFEVLLNILPDWITYYIQEREVSATGGAASKCPGSDLIRTIHANASQG